ncbi:kinase-like domain-containing protein [Ochromonadaceae sp. CCMP2298]|nr:kinase-like domain-containing protein [Ochromonadaceae sp. CCMP2298]|mmetsp:Transcript_23097/g.51317  ORF Transcript_23097/g.51317 Transcript_23097/m.51317 type:complete len:381 (-) Transcript_23097:99-1241(-)|eukprot:CAMPEP_0173244442 /NCGR_PEP_ID=MMETSP1142-20121109/16099_1 /TAXON_ID=483371 /ORGANISM="non described non described, Strain CCMP2298" /LENGTH=380 /DNA_ID=CAMNT_0014176225 /DNA_START=56 /DNA_END=1198 /DNA_ORIENTATION=-
MSNFRSCCQCGQVLSDDNYTTLQWSYGTGLSRCKFCLHGVSAAGNSNRRVIETSRLNQSSRASFPRRAIENPFASGAFRWVARGEYIDGPRVGQPCVCKWFKSGFTFEDEFFHTDILAVDQTALILEQFNALRIIEQMVRINIPAVWVFDEHTDKAGTKVLQEPFIECWQKFNSNTGWCDTETPWPRVMQGLSHFSYHASGGMLVLCDLQGGVYHDGVIITDPVINSADKSFGCTDLGPEGISSFFSRHECGEFCRAEWVRPTDQTEYYPLNKGTSMYSTPTESRPPAHNRSPNAPLTVFRHFVPRYQEDGYNPGGRAVLEYHNYEGDAHYGGAYSDQPLQGHPDGLGGVQGVTGERGLDTEYRRGSDDGFEDHPDDGLL